jgi:phospholipid-binding lipoprotein MlaA
MQFLILEFLMKILFFAILLLFFGGCANKNTTSSPHFVQNDSFTEEEDDFENEFSSSDASGGSDPLEGYNRVMTKFNDATITYIISPVAQGYKEMVPKGVRGSIGNFFDNLMFPIRFVNNLLQGKVANAFSESGRFIINTTVGFLGFANVATDIYKVEEHYEDFGQTLGYWGVPGGPHIVLPFLGPSNLRDFGSSFVDMTLNPTNYFEQRPVNMFANSNQAFGATSVEMLNGLPQVMDMYNTVTKGAIDLYPLLKNTYEQHRNALIKE